jgi:hypothetical protein
MKGYVPYTMPVSESPWGMFAVAFDNKLSQSGFHARPTMELIIYIHTAKHSVQTQILKEKHRVTDLRCSFSVRFLSLIVRLKRGQKQEAI